MIFDIAAGVFLGGVALFILFVLGALFLESLD